MNRDWDWDWDMGTTDGLYNFHSQETSATVTGNSENHKNKKFHNANREVTKFIAKLNICKSPASLFLKVSEMEEQQSENSTRGSTNC